MNDGTPLIPWQHEEFYSIEPVTNQDLDVHCFPSSNSRGREIKDQTHSDQECFIGFIYTLYNSAVNSYWESILKAHYYDP